jgi:hypothetical protein
MRLFDKVKNISEGIKAPQAGQTLKKSDKATEAKAAEIKAKYKAANKPATSISYDAGVQTTPSNAKNFIAKMKEIKEKAKLGKAQGVPEGADPATHERCVKEVKAKGHDKASAFAICNAAGAGLKKGDVVEFPKKSKQSTIDNLALEGRQNGLAKMKAMMEAAKKKKTEESLQKGYKKDENGNLVYEKDAPVKNAPAATISYGSSGIDKIDIHSKANPAQNWKRDWNSKTVDQKNKLKNKLAQQRATGQKQPSLPPLPKQKTALETIKENQAKKSGDMALPPPAMPPKPDLMKDNQPHPANSPEDKAHDIVEEHQSLKDALSVLSSSDKMKSMFAHLRELKDKKNLRDKENQMVGQEPELSKKSSWMKKCSEIMKKNKWNPTLDY